MKQALKIYRWAWVIVLAVTVLIVVLVSQIPSHHKMAKDPKNVEKIVPVELPDIMDIKSEDNLDRGASRWDVFTHRCQFADELSEEHILAFEELCAIDTVHWHKNEQIGYYKYSNDGGIDALYFIDCYIYNDHSYVEYSVDESEGIFVSLPIVLVYTILFIWGLVLMIRLIM